MTTIVQLDPLYVNFSIPGNEYLQFQQFQAEGRLKVFSGPMKDNQGNLKVPAGASYPDAELGKMTWYAEGIVVGRL